MAKRNATSELNHDNWNEEEAPEEAGTFRKAAPDVMQHRIIKSAKRRSVGTPENNVPRSPFAAFGGFKATTNTSTPSTSTFGFLSNLDKDKKEASNGKMEKDENDKSVEYYSSLKGLNQCVSQWIKSHVDTNPFCILTPIFKDYERYLKEIVEKEAKREQKNKEGEAANSPTKSPAKSTLTSSAAQEKSEKESADSNKPQQITSFSTPCFGSTSSSFNFGCATSGGSNLTAGFSFGSTQAVTKPDEKEVAEEAEDDQPPKVEFTPVVEEGAIYSKRCKVFVKKEGSFQERGVGTLYVKPVGQKTQLIVRADTSLGNLLLNTLLTSGMPLQRMGVNNVMLVCVPTPDTKPPPVPVLLRLKTSADADEAMEKLKGQISD